MSIICKLPDTSANLHTAKHDNDRTQYLLHLTRTVGVKSLSRYLQYLTLIDSESPINLKHQTISVTVGRRKHSAAHDGANTAPYQSCHRDNSLPTTRIGIRMAAPGNAFSLNRRAVMCNSSAHCRTK